MSDGEAGRMTEDDALREQFTGDGIMAVFSARSRSKTRRRGLNPDPG